MCSHQTRTDNGYGQWNLGAPVVLGCECPEWGCWSFRARIELTDDLVRWAAFEGPKTDRDYSDLGPFVFDRREYENAVADVERSLG